MFRILYLNGLVSKTFANKLPTSKGLLSCRPCSETLTLKRFVMELASVVKIFESVVPPDLAEEWDNTGLLIQPLDRKPISTILFTNDLTESVMMEALSSDANLIISYHPPIFAPIKSLGLSNWKDRIVMECVKNSIAVYSPHTACDAVKNGVNDWLINCFDLSDSQPIKQSSSEVQPKYSHMIEFSSPVSTKIYEELSNLSKVVITCSRLSDNVEHVEILSDENSMKDVVNVLRNKKPPPSITITESVSMRPLCGMGRIGKLLSPTKLRDCIEIVKKHLKLSRIRFAIANNHCLDTEISTVAVSAGSGSSILKGVVADLYITGEMSHHDLLDANHKNVSVILSEHSNSERGYLQELIAVLKPKLRGINLITSSVDKDPILIV
ncbi:NIF3-like protein 1 [Uloborus diversus]|uniref:NIF3-like protein 1 n=1 Tax=Uloborus diversus TaxID=327109 RepID=UPI00240A4C98|nr:NIF3-like protein 1 [Uloborus diversus]